jgi:hypothetical protein
MGPAKPTPQGFRARDLLAALERALAASDAALALTLAAELACCPRPQPANLAAFLVDLYARCYVNSDARVCERLAALSAEMLAAADVDGGGGAGLREALAEFVGLDGVNMRCSIRDITRPCRGSHLKSVRAARGTGNMPWFILETR